jgi:hypothetical protein
MKRSIFTLATLMASSLMAHDPTPSCLANPLSGLAGNYTFQVEGISPHAFGITGTMNASIGANRVGTPVGVLRITATSFFGNSVLGPWGPTGPIGPVQDRKPAAASSEGREASVTRLETDIGSFQVNSTCTGGTLTFNLSSHPMQYDFWFLDGGRRLSLVSTINGLEATGIAVAGPSGCPAGLTDPLQLLPVRWTFTARGGSPLIQTGPVGPIFNSVRGAVLDTGLDDPYAIAGFWNASVGVNRANVPVGLLAITATSNLGFGGSVTRREADAGSFQANANCSGGTLTFNLSSRPVQFDFWYVDGFQKLYFIATNGMPVLGEASR